jgi:PAS domain S-box-containing protein
MARPNMVPTGKERSFRPDDIIVSKTDLQGKITYANRTFLEVAGYHEDEVIGLQHNMIRHPDMPRCVFELLWTMLKASKEVFAYVVNLAKNGDHYWVYAHVTPTFDRNNQIVGYHSSRRVPSRQQIQTVEPLYRTLCQEEERHSNKKKAIQASTQMLQDVLKGKGMDYAEFVWTI